MAESHNFLSTDGDFQPHSQLANRSDHQSNRPQLATRASVRGVPWQVRDLKPHPGYAQLGIKIPASRLNELIELGEDAFIFPLFVTSAGIVIDGYARLEIARLQGRETVICVELDIPEEEALRRLILCHRRLTGLPAFCRIKLALPMTKSLKEKALQHQQDGGKNKGSSKLTDAQKIDVRKKIAAVVGISVGTLSHALEVLKTGDPEIWRALCNGEIKIDRAWRWSKESRSRQRDSLKLYRRRRGMERVAEKLISRQLKRFKSKRLAARRWKSFSSSEIVSRLGCLPPEVLRAVDVIFIKAPAPILALSEDIAQRAGFREEAPSCN
ncbi:MAG TPA: hypothetical protein VJW20_01780 [Candidatus Angelobacter sp.]|nr:hypothetical protein [Candidatus Angelobacter sp.]